jgi:hypothetical protein
VKLLAPIPPHTLLEPVTIRFKGPAGEREETITEVQLRRPKGKDIRAMDRAEGDIGKTMALLARVSGLEPSVLDEMDGADVVALLELVAGFLPNGQPTGEGS